MKFDSETDARKRSISLSVHPYTRVITIFMSIIHFIFGEDSCISVNEHYRPDTDMMIVDFAVDFVFIPNFSFVCA